VSRLPYLRYDDLDDNGQLVWDSVTGSRGAGLINADGGLVGPFNAFVHAPEVGRHLSSLGATLRFGTSIERRLSELAIITVGARWHAEFEWWAHARTAVKYGVAESVVDAIGKGEEPAFDRDDERVIFSVARELTRDAQVDAELYATARQVLGNQAMVELVALCGYYTLISYLLNAFDVPIPPEATPRWPEKTR
jgi:4-carboxymuconolactone decarboxylase